MFRVFTTEQFDKDYEKLDESEKKKVRKIRDQLKEKGGKVGKPLRKEYFREKKFEGKRLYFLVYKEFMVVLGVGISGKKIQQHTIDKIISDIKSHERYIKDRLED